MFTLIIFSSCNDISSQKSNPAIKSVDEFYFISDDGYSDLYNSQTGIFQRQYIDSTYSVQINLSKEEKELIFKLYKKLNVSSFPNEFNTPEAFSLPPIISSIKFCGSNQDCKLIKIEFSDLEYLHLEEIDEAIKFKYFFDYVWNRIRSNETYQNIPETDILYM